MKKTGKPKKTRCKAAPKPAFVIRREPKPTKKQIVLAAECETLKHHSTGTLHSIRRETNQIRDNRLATRAEIASQLKELDRQINALGLKSEAIDAVLRQTR